MEERAHEYMFKVTYKFLFCGKLIIKTATGRSFNANMHDTLMHEYSCQMEILLLLLLLFLLLLLIFASNDYLSSKLTNIVQCALKVVLDVQTFH